ncbi:MAG: T9SS type A sorting domain-containing protein [candidate division Zixibacteria bacterium]|nr:T9SS type A sorting domain-containing protein [candidate division Zixibacteria bacterium]
MLITEILQSLKEVIITRIYLRIGCSFIILLSSIAFGQPPLMYADQDDILPVTAAYAPDTNFTLMSYALPNNPECELIYNNHLYLGAGSILQVYELGEDGIPILTGQVNTRGLMYEFEHDGQYLYIANSWNGISIYEGNNFIDPSEVGHYQTDMAVGRICVSGDSLYYMAGEGLGILNIQDRTNPFLERQIYHYAYELYGSLVNDICVFDHYLLSMVQHGAPNYRKLIAIFDLDSADPIPDQVDSIYISGNTGVKDLKLIDDILYLCTSDSLAIYEFNPGPHPVHLGSVPFEGGFSGFDMEYRNRTRYGYLCHADSYPGSDSGWSKIYEIQLNDLNNPQVLDSSVIVLNTYYYDLIQNYEYTYAICNHGFYMEGYDPGLYVYEWDEGRGGEVIHHDRQYSFCKSVAAKGDIAYAGTYYENITILDMVDKTNPQIVGEIPGFIYAIQMKIIDDRLYVLTPAKLTIFDITDPFVPVELGRLYLQTGGYSINFHIHNNLVYINYWWLSPQLYGCVLIADISDPTDMTVYFDGDLYGAPNPSHLNYPILFLLGYGGHMTIYDVSDSTDPYYYTTEQMNHGSSSCYARDTLLYMFGSCYQLWDISNPRDPQWIQHWNIGARYDDVQLVDGKLFMADFTTGSEVFVWDIDESPLEPYHVGYFRRDVSGFMSIDLPYVYIPGGEHGLITVRFDDPTEIEDKEILLPEATDFMTAYPNPFNGTISFLFNKQSTDVSELKIYDVAGRLVKSIDISNNDLSSPVAWDGTDADGVGVSSGVYFIKHNGVNSTLTKKVVLLR